jgi:hypothetical protein
MTRKGALAATSTSILKGCCSLAFLLVFLLAAASPASAATATTTTLNVGLATSPGVSISTAPYGTSVTLTAVVTGAGGAVGTVNFTYGSTPATVSGCGSVTVAFGLATCTTASLPLSSNELLKAAFTPTDSANFAPSSTATATAFAVTQFTSSTTLAIGLQATPGTPIATAPYGTSVTLTATVAGTAAAVSSPGTVNFTYGTDPIVPINGCVNISVLSGAATCTTAALPVATNENLNAVFTSSTAAFTSSNTSSATAFAVTQITTTTALAIGLQATPNTPIVTGTYGASVTLTATVTGAGAAGTVSFSTGASPIAACSGLNAVTLASGSAACTTATLPKGANSLSASFTPTNSTDFTSSTSSSTTYTVTAAAPTVTLTPSVGTSTFGSAVTLTVGGLPAGAGAVGSSDTVTFFYGSSATAASDVTPVACTNVVTISGGGASCTTVMLPAAATPGNYLKAVFTPGTVSDYGTAASYSSALQNVIVSKVAPSVTLSTLPSGTTSVGASVTLIATLPSAADTGNVAFTYGTKSTAITTSLSCATQPVSSTTTLGVTTTTATCAAPAALTAAAVSSPGLYLQAVYTPTTAANFTAATATTTGNLIVVGAVATTTAVTVPAGTNYYGANPVLTATVSCGSTPVTCTAATGSVAFYNNNVLIGAGTAVASGQSTLTPTAPLPVGTNAITAIFTSTSTVGYTNSTSPSLPVIVVATPTKAVTYAFTGAITAPTGVGVAPTGTAVAATSASNSLTNDSFTLYATIAPSSGLAVINGGHVSFYDVSTAGSTLLGTAAVTAVNSVGTASFTINCATASLTCSAPLTLGRHYFAATYGGVYNGTGTAQFAGSMSETVPVTISGAAVLTITAGSPSVTYGSAVPAIVPAPYTISGAAPVSGDLASCTTSSKDANGIPIYTCATLPSLTKAPVCTTAYTAASTVAGAAPITSCSGAIDSNYTIAPYVNGKVTVTGAAPAWSNFNAQEATYGTAITFAATTNSGGTITYVVNTTSNCTVSCSTKNVTSIPATTLPGTYYVTATVTANGNYAAASTQRTMMVNAARPSVNWPDAKAISYGTPLSSSLFGTCTAKYGTITVTGTCTWNVGSTVPNVGSSQSATFTPSASYGGAYATVTELIPVNVTPVKPTISTPPNASRVASGSFVYANNANVSILSGGTAKLGNTTLSGSWSWTCAATPSSCVAIVANATYVSVTFTPTGVNAANYTTVSSTSNATSASVSLLTAPSVTTWPTASAITYGQPLSSSILNTTNAVSSTPGRYTWTSPALGGLTPANTFPTVVGSPDKECVTFTPTDPTNAPVYSNGAAACSVNAANIPVTVTAAAPAVNWSAVPAPAIYFGQALSASVLPTTTSLYASGLQGAGVAGNFGWDANDYAATTYPAIGTSQYLADFTSTDATGNYSSSTITGQVSLTVNPCGLQDSKNSVNAVAYYVNADASTQIPSDSVMLSLGGVSNESVVCAVTAGPGDTTIAMPTLVTPAISQNSTYTNTADSINYGTNAAVLAYGTVATAGSGAIVTITDGGDTHASDGTAGSISTSGNYTSGVFASMGGTVDITNTAITTTGDFSRALDATYNGTLAIYNVTAATSGNNSGVIVTGTGSGQVTVNGGTYTNNNASGAYNTAIRAAGTCPAGTVSACKAFAGSQTTPWSTVSVNDGTTFGGVGTTIAAVDGPAVVVEGGNNVTIDSTGNLTTLTGALGNNYGVFLYQSGTLVDATPATAKNPTTFSMTGGSLTYNCDANSAAGDYAASCAGIGQTLANDQNLLSTLFSVTNTTAVIGLTDVAVTNNTNSAADGILLTAAQLSTGPATVQFNLVGETVSGDVIADIASTVNMSLAWDNTTGTTWTGTFANAIYYDSGNSGPQTLGTVNLTIDPNSSWIVTSPSVTVNKLTETDSDTTFPNVFCAVSNGGCQVNIANPTAGQPSSFNPTTY